MKILFLLEPSEWKNVINKYKNEEHNFAFEKPLKIETNITETN